MESELKKREERLGWKRLAGRWLSFVDWGGPGITPLRAGLRVPLKSVDWYWNGNAKRANIRSF